MKMNITTIHFLILTVICFSCKSYEEFSTYNEITQYPNSHIKEKLSVGPFLDSRGRRQTFMTAVIGLIPLVPWGIAIADRPTFQENDFRPREEFPSIIAERIKNKNAFENVNMTTKRSPDSGDYLLHGEIISTLRTERLMTYGVSLYAGLLYFLLALDSECIDDEIKLKVYLSKKNMIVATKEYSLAQTYCNRSNRIKFKEVKKSSTSFNSMMINLSDQIFFDILELIEREGGYKK